MAQPNSESSRQVVADSESGRSGIEDGKKPYFGPSLQCYGGLVDVTQFGGSVVLDSGAGLGPDP
jgi:hypothetical protein